MTFLVLELLNVCVEAVEALAPELLEPAEPIPHRFQLSGIERVKPAAPHVADADEAHLAQNTEVFGRPGLREAQSAGQLVDAALASPEETQDATPLRFGNRVERIGSRCRSRHARTYAYMGMFVNRIA
jgi:hypothetical protein